MTRTSNDDYRDGKLFNGYDYVHQAWVANGKYVACGHPDEMGCSCVTANCMKTRSRRPVT